MNALIGHTGFVGSSLCRQASFDAKFNSSNIGEISHRSFDLVVCAGLPAAKWLANRDPEADTANMMALCKALGSVEATRFVLISTVDVYPQIAGLDESADCHASDNHAYGRNRLIFEDFIADRFPAHNILRLPALFGEGLKKNIIFDLVHDNCLEAINPGSSFQWYDLERLWADIGAAITHDLALVGLMTEPIVSGQIIDRFFPERKNSVGAQAGPEIHYDIKTRFAENFGGTGSYIMDREETLSRMGRYVEAAIKDLAA